MRKLLKALIGISFVVYLFALFVILFLRSRGDHYIDLSLLEYIKRSANFVPFKTIHQFITAYQNDRLNTDILMENLLGNLLLFFPMGLYLPFHFRKLSKTSLFVISMLILLFIVEATQILTRRGRFDIDDFILNMIGALIGFGVWNIPFVKRNTHTYFKRRSNMQLR